MRSRGAVGFSANQGLSTSRLDGMEAFDMPATCNAFSAPVNPTGVTRRTAGSTVPLTFTLEGGNEGLDIFAAGYPASQPIDCSTKAPTGTLVPAEPSGDSGLTLDPATGQYRYVWKTDKAWARHLPAVNREAQRRHGVPPALLVPLAVVAAVACGSDAVRGSGAPSPAVPSWRLVWSDDFKTPGVPDPAKWYYDVGGHGWGNQELQFYTERRIENARVDGGRLIVEVRRERWQERDYTSVRLNSRQGWTYARIEVRAQLPSGRGTWPAIWMLAGRLELRRSGLAGQR